MLKRHAQFLKSLLFLVDLGLICLCWVGAYYLRFSEIVEPVTKGIPPLRIYLLSRPSHSHPAYVPSTQCLVCGLLRVALTA